MVGRQILVRLHRYVGLTIAAFIVVAGVTGSAIAFRDELDVWLNPELFRATAQGEPLRSDQIRAKVEQSDPRIAVVLLPLLREPNESHAVGVGPRLDPATGRPFALDYNQVFVDPVSGAILGRRKSGACCFSRPNLMPFLYIVHNNLFLPGRWGSWLMGGIALIWTFDCFVGFALTWPRSRPLLARWRQVWTIRRGTGVQRLVLDFHRASGLWFWSILLMLAVSGVALNLSDEIFRPVVSAFSPVKPTPRAEGRPRLKWPPPPPVLDFEQAAARAEDEAQRRGWPVKAFDVGYAAPYRVYIVSLAQPGTDPDAGLGHPHLYIDSQTGEVLRADRPGEGSAGDIFLQWQLPLHSGKIIGLTGQILISIAGLATSALSIAGVIIWWRKRRARHWREQWTVGAGAPAPP